MDEDRGGVHRSGPGHDPSVRAQLPPPLGSWGGDPAGFVYSPKYLFSGIDAFDYVAFDGIDVSHAATVTITVLAPPVVDRDPDRDGVDDEFDGCPDQAGAGRPDGCPDRDGDGVPEYDDACPDVAAAGRDDGCPPVVDERAWAEATRRQARRLGRRWHRPAERAAAWRTGHIAMMVHVPNDAATARAGRPASRYVRERSADQDRSNEDRTDDVTQRLRAEPSPASDRPRCHPPPDEGEHKRERPNREGQ